MNRITTNTATDQMDDRIAVAKKFAWRRILSEPYKIYKESIDALERGETGWCKFQTIYAALNTRAHRIDKFQVSGLRYGQDEVSCTHNRVA